jgi:hypothetical protein
MCYWRRRRSQRAISAHGFGGAGTGPATRFARDLVVYMVAHQPRRLRLPAAPLPAGASADVIEGLLFDDEMNERYFRQVASSCYRPALERFGGMLDRGMKLAIGFSMTFLDQALRWDPELLDGFRLLVRHPHVELVAVEPGHSFVMLWDADQFVIRMRTAADRLEAVFGVRRRTADTTELMMSDVIYHALALAGYEVGFIDGRAWVLHGRGLASRLLNNAVPAAGHQGASCDAERERVMVISATEGHSMTGPNRIQPS